MRKQDKTTAVIAGILATKARAMSQQRPTAIKHPLLSKIIADSVADQPEGTRLPGVRDLALALNSSLVTTQRAVTDLINEGILSSKPRSGIFVGAGKGGAAGRNAIKPDTAMRSPFHSKFHFGTDSAASYQREFWNGLTAAFQRRYPNAEPVIHFEADSSDRSKPLDVYERSAWSRYWTADQGDILDINGFINEDLPVKPTGGGLLPLYYRTYSLFFNPDLLERYEIPAPNFRTFDGQIKYLKDIAPALLANDLDAKPFSIQEPVTLLGADLTVFLSLIKSGKEDSEAFMALADRLEKLITFCTLCRRARSSNELTSARSDFLKGKRPFYFGYSVDTWEFLNANLSFKLAAYPTLCMGDTFFMWPMEGVVSGHSQHPVESVRFLSFLLEDDAQNSFVVTGNFAANPKIPTLPAFKADVKWIQKTLSRSHPFELTSSDAYYLAINILNGELSRALQEKLEGSTVLRRAVQLGRSYLKHSEESSKAVPA